MTESRLVDSDRVPGFSDPGSSGQALVEYVLLLALLILPVVWVVGELLGAVRSAFLLDLLWISLPIP